MKCVKLNFKDILFYAPNWSDEKGTSYGRFSAFLNFKDILFYAPNWSDAKGASYGHFTDFSSPTFEARKKIKVSSNPLNQKNMPTMAGIL